MLSAEHRMRSSEDFAQTIKGGKRRGTSTVMVYALRYPENTKADLSTKVGFVVSKKVGNSVVRHRVSRQLRHAVKPLLAQCVVPARIVVQARPKAAHATFHTLTADIFAGLQAVGIIPPSAER